ncbi:hypothetical protein CASFOL_042881 [Castilleja foliolosa]|uniref:Uncharacterized protein n=1 Tax=Castilleja foliolosa TaxID=1961234 RepID=A0ABD3B7D2_9LAMI
MVGQEDDETLKVTTNVVFDPPEKAGENDGTAPDTVLDTREGKQNICTSIVDEQPRKAALKKPSVSKKAAKAPETVLDSREGEQITCTSNVDEQPKKAPLKKPSVSKKTAKGIVIQEPAVVKAKTTGANSKAGAPDKGKTIVVEDKIVRGGKRRKADVKIPKDLTPRRTKSVLGECSSKK